MVVAVAVLVFGLGVGLWWLTRPKIDPRFVGEWRCMEADYSFVLRSDGSYEYFELADELEDEPPWEPPLSWTVKGDVLFLTIRHDRTLNGLWGRIDDAYWRVRGRPNYWKRFRILEITPATLRMQQQPFDPDIPETYERLAK
jgi:hypothetical protein